MITARGKRRAGTGERESGGGTRAAGTCASGVGQKSGAPLGALAARSFMQRYWQRHPCLIRQAIPGFEAPLTARALVDLAGDDAVESRLITRRRGRWALAHGPFDPEDLPPLTQRNWTLLVQGVDLHDEAAHALLARFRFVPDARVDDLMISLASDGGGVGPHVDSYDVFLLQAWGRRRWRIGPAARSPRLVEGLPLKILADFEPDQEWLLEPGDMLYLPPGWAHEGVAIGPCMTCSVGFRAPSRHEFLAAFLADAADAPGGADPRFGDPGREPAGVSPARLPDDLHETLARWARDWRPDAGQIERFVGRFLTEPKPSVWFDPPRATKPARFVEQARRHGIALDRRSRMLWRGRHVFLNGETVVADATARTLLRRLAERRALAPGDLAAIASDASLWTMLHGWFEAGWLRAGQAAQASR